MQNIIQVLAGVVFAVSVYAFVLLVGILTKRYLKERTGKLPVLFTGVLTLFLYILTATYLSLYSHLCAIIFRHSLLPIACGLLFFGWKNQDFLRKYKQEFIANSVVIALATLFAFGVQFYPYSNFSLDTPANNFILGLPIDYKISLMFSESIVQGQLLTFGDWLGSDRPPLFSGAVLFFSAPFVALQTTYLYAGTGIQLLLIPIVIKVIEKGLGETLKLSDKLLIAFCFVSTPLFFHNLSFLWPKIFAAIFMLLAIYCLFISSHKQTLALRIFAAIALAFSYLSHGGTAFAIPAIALVFIFQNRSIRDLAHGMTVFLSFVVLNLPWIFYQKIIQPPGDRLLKWHLLGQIDIVPESINEIFIEKYSQFELSNLWDRLNTSFLLQAKFYDLASYGLHGATQFAEQSFSRMYLSVGLFSLFLLPFAFSRHAIIRNINVLIVLMCLFWFVLPFNGAISMHEGPYIIPVLIAFNVIFATCFLSRKWDFKFKDHVKLSVLTIPGLLSLVLFNVHRHELIEAYQLKTDETYQIESVQGSGIGRDYNNTQVKGMEIYGSFVQSDADVADLIINASNGRYIYYYTGPSAQHQSIRVESDGEVIYQSNETVIEKWTRIDLGERDHISIHLIDQGREWGEWSAIALGGLLKAKY